jgi:hypothetical protein
VSANHPIAPRDQVEERGLQLCPNVPQSYSPPADAGWFGIRSTCAGLGGTRHDKAKVTSDKRRPATEMHFRGNACQTRNAVGT